MYLDGLDGLDQQIVGLLIVPKILWRVKEQKKQQKKKLKSLLKKQKLKKLQPRKLRPK